VSQAGTAVQLEEAGRYADAAAVYERLATTAPAAERTDFQVSAAEDWALGGDTQHAWTLVKAVDEKNLYPALMARVEILKAQLYIADHQPQLALQHLKFSLVPLTQELKAKTTLVRGQAHLALNDLPATVQDWTEREGYLTRGKDVDANHDLIWNTLTESHAPIDVSKLPANLSPIARGWLELAVIDRVSWQQPEKFLEQVKQWQSRYPDHPAEQLLVPSLIAKQQALTRRGSTLPTLREVGTSEAALVRAHADRHDLPRGLEVERYAALLGFAGGDALIAALLRDHLARSG